MLSRCKQVKGEKPPASSRGHKAQEEGQEEAEEDEEGGCGDGSAVNIADLIPRTDIR